MVDEMWEQDEKHFADLCMSELHMIPGPSKREVYAEKVAFLIADSGYSESVARNKAFEMYKNGDLMDV